MAALILYQSLMIKYGKVTKLTQLQPPEIRALRKKQELNRNWLLSDVLFLNLLLLLQHWDRYALETWRFKHFTAAFTYSYDVESYFTYPLFFFQVSVLISQRPQTLYNILTKVTIVPLSLVVFFGFLLSFDYLYRLRLIFSSGMLLASGTIALGTCFAMGQRHQERVYEEGLKKKLKKKQKMRDEIFKKDSSDSSDEDSS